MIVEAFVIFILPKKEGEAVSRLLLLCYERRNTMRCSICGSHLWPDDRYYLLHEKIICDECIMSYLADYAHYPDDEEDWSIPMTM